jgi:hypothetical protein
MTKRRVLNGLTWLAVAGAALWLNSTWAQDYESEIAAQCAEKGCDAGLVTAVMYCESGGDPDAWHPNPYGGSDVGLFQVNDATWGEVAWAGPWVQIDWATTMIANGGIGHWWPSQHCWGG